MQNDILELANQAEAEAELLARASARQIDEFLASIDEGADYDD